MTLKIEGTFNQVKKEDEKVIEENEFASIATGRMPESADETETGEENSNEVNAEKEDSDTGDVKVEETDKEKSESEAEADEGKVAAETAEVASGGDGSEGKAETRKEPETPVKPIPEKEAAPAVKEPSDAEKAAYTAEMQRRQAAFYADLVKRYQVTPELVEELKLEPEKVLPNLLARTHMDVLGQMQGSLPQMVAAQIEQFNKARETVQKSEDAFLSAWPQLKRLLSERPQERDNFIKYAGAFKQMGLSAEEYTKKFGKFLCAEYDLPLSYDPEDSAKDSKVTKIEDAKPKKMKPFKPAGSAGTASRVTPESEENPNEYVVAAKELVDARTKKSSTST
jgi:hypothetical protein